MFMVPITTHLLPFIWTVAHSCLITAANTEGPLFLQELNQLQAPGSPGGKVCQQFGVQFPCVTGRGGSTRFVSWHEETSERL